MQQALDALEMHVLGFDGVRKMELAIEALEAELAKPDKTETLKKCLFQMQNAAIELAKPDPVIVPFPSFMRKRVEQAIDNSINPHGMSVHDSKAKVLISDLKLMLLIADLAAQQLVKPEQELRKEWVGLTDDEIEDAWGNTPMMLNARDGGARKVFARAIEAKLKEKNT
jgi:hypothetical protein